MARGRTDAVAEPSGESFEKAYAAAARVAKEHDISSVDYEKLSQWKSDGKRTLYLFDVRTEEEFLRGHMSGAIHVAGGQLVQTTDEYIAVRNARVVLLDDKTIRAVMTASLAEADGGEGRSRF